MASGFDPAHLRPEATLNRTVLAAVPGVPAELVGRTAYELLNAKTVEHLVPDAARVSLIGGRIAALLATLHLGEPASGLGVSPSAWRRAYLSNWRQISHVSLGGGLAQLCEQGLAGAANQALRRSGLDAITVHVPEQAASLALIGAARATTTCRARLVLDLGHSWVKHGLARYDDKGRLSAIDTFPAIHVDPALTAPHEVVGFVCDVLKEAMKAAGDVQEVVACLAAYVGPNGVVADPRSYYHPLASVTTSDWNALLAEHESKSASLRFLHDGTAAARAITAEAGAVITLGTALGVGFTPNPATLVPFSPHFSMNGVLRGAAAPADVGSVRRPDVCRHVVPDHPRAG